MLIKQLNALRKPGQHALIPVREQIRSIVPQLPDGEVLSVPEMAARLGVTRNPVHNQAEAAIAEGLAVRLSGRVFFGNPRALRALQATVRRQLENK